MSASGKSILVFGVYLIGMGTGLLFMPGLVLSLLGFAATNEIWTRVVGALALLLAFYYIQAARANLRPLIQWSVYGRLAVGVALAVFALVGLAGPIMILLGGTDIAGALWTGWALRKEQNVGASVTKMSKPAVT